MAIEFNCEQCNKSLRVGEANAGKKANCPNCGNVCTIPEMTTAFDELPDLSIPQADPLTLKPRSQATREPKQQTAREPKAKKPLLKKPVRSLKQPKPTPRIIKPTPKPSNKKYFVATDFGQTYGPVSQRDLVAWVAEGRITSGYVIREASQKTGVYASELFPELGPVALPAATARTIKPKPVASKYEPEQMDPTDPPFRPTKIENISRVIEFSWIIFKDNFGMLFAASILVGLPGATLGIAGDFFVDPENTTAVLIYLACLPVVLLLATWLSIGFIQMCCKLARGQETSFSQLFAGIGRLIPFTFVGCLYSIAVTLGLLLLLVPGFAFGIFFWPVYFLVVEKKAGVFESFSKSLEITVPNILNILVLIAASCGFAMLGIIGCGIGLLFVVPYLWILWTAAYLMMTGQIPEVFKKTKIARLRGIQKPH